MSTSNTISLNGGNYVRFPKDDQFYPTDGLTISFDLNQRDWNASQSSQIIGNYGSQGYGIFFENGLRTFDELTVFDCGNNHLFGLTTDAELISQRGLPERTPTPIISVFHTDRNGTKYYYDQANFTISVIDRRDIIITEFQAQNNPTVNQLKTDASGNIYILDETNSVIQQFNSNGNYLSDIPLDYLTHNNFAFLSTGEIKTFFSNSCSPMLVDCDDNYYNLFGINIYRNGLPWLAIGPTANTFGIDSKNDIWVVYDGNRLTKFSQQGIKRYDKVFHEIFPCSDRADRCGTELKKRSLSFTKECSENGVEEFAWIGLEDSNYLLKLNSVGVIVRCSPVGNYLDTTRFDKSFSGTLMCVNGDHTGYYDEKLFGTNCGDTGSKIVAYISLLGHCDNDFETEQGTVSLVRLEATVSNLTSGYHNIRFRYSNTDGLAILYIDGQERDRVFLRGDIYYSPDNKLPTLVGADSGRFRSRQQEIGLTDPKYFVGDIRNLGLYNGDVVVASDVLSNKTLKMIFPTEGTQSFVETVDKFFLFRNSGFKSARMDIRIKNTGIDMDKQKLRNKIEELVPTQVIVDGVECQNEIRIKDLV